MTTGVRRRAESGCYHVTLRGNGKQIIFEDDGDRRRFLTYLARLPEHDVAIIAWCLMSNHVHLVLEDAGDALSGEMQRLASSYAHYFNKRYGRSGHVFETRFKSQAIEDDAYLLAAVRYVHLNPAVAGMGAPDTYPWSSYRSYIGLENAGAVPVSVSAVLGLLDGVAGFREFHAQRIPGGDLRFDDPDDVSLDDVIAIARAVAEPFGCASASDAKALPKAERDRCIRALRQHGLSVKDISRLTGVSEPTVYRILRAAE